VSLNLKHDYKDTVQACLYQEKNSNSRSEFTTRLRHAPAAQRGRGALCISRRAAAIPKAMLPRDPDRKPIVSFFGRPRHGQARLFNHG